MSAENVAVIRRFLEEVWPSHDVVAVVGHFTDDGVFHNMPHEPWTGRAEIHAAVTRLCAQVDRFDFKVLNIGSTGDVVYAERVDTCVVGDTIVDIPVHGVFEMRDGRIAAWRDYFDSAVVTPLYAAIGNAQRKQSTTRETR